MSKKTSTLANFNCTFGKENKPMLTYFNEIIYPAFKSKIIRKVSDDEYFFDDVKIKEVVANRYALVGILIRKTKLEVRTEYDYNKGVTYTHKFYDSAPISIFTIFLDNHRMIYTTNQKGSPNIRSFSATVKEVLKKFVYNYNENKEKEDKIPYPSVDIVNLPSKKNISEKLKEVKKIKKLTFKLFNPNGDFDMSSAYDGMLEQLEQAGAKKGSFVINSPTKFDNVAEMISDTKGLAESKLDVEYKSGGKGIIDHETMGEKFPFDFPEETTIDSVSTVVTNTLLKNKEDLNKISDENQNIYSDKKGQIILLSKYKN